MPNECCIETYKKLTRSRELVDHWEGIINLLEDDLELLDKEFKDLSNWRNGLFINNWSRFPEIFLKEEVKEKMMRLEILRAHWEGKINLLEEKVIALHEESSVLVEWGQDFPEK